jgi:hypothetical protein
MSMSAGPIFSYRELVVSGELSADDAQLAVAEALDVLHTRLVGYAPRGTKGSLRGLLRIGAPRPVAFIFLAMSGAVNPC